MNNVDFLSAVASHPAFAAADLETGFIERHAGDLLPAAGQVSDRILALAALDVLAGRRQRTAAPAGDPIRRGSPPTAGA